MVVDLLGLGVEGTEPGIDSEQQGSVGNPALRCNGLSQDRSRGIVDKLPWGRKDETRRDEVR
jgi:hypothetical protein